MRAFFVLVTSLSAGAAIGLTEAVAVILRETQKLPALHDKLLLFGVGVLCFGIPAANRVCAGENAASAGEPDCATISARMGRDGDYGGCCALISHPTRTGGSSPGTSGYRRAIAYRGKVIAARRSRKLQPSRPLAGRVATRSGAGWGDCANSVFAPSPHGCCNERLMDRWRPCVSGHVCHRGVWAALDIAAMSQFA